MLGLKLTELKPGEYYWHIANGDMVLVMSERSGILFNSVTGLHENIELRNNQLAAITAKDEQAATV